MTHSLTTRKLTHQYLIPTYGRFDLEIVRGSGSRVWTETGKQLLDFGAGIAVCSLGHAHPEVGKAVAHQCTQLLHTSNLYYTRPQAELARQLINIVGADGKVFFCNSGAEANEGLIKLTRKFGDAKRYEMITFQGSFHGRTMAGISATGQEKVKKGFAPLVPGFVHVPYGDLEAVRAAIRPETAAILVEPIQGEGGIRIATGQFLQGLRRLCDEHNLLLLFDEIQCGLGRTGDWCGWKSIAGESVIPDGIAWAKGIANGLPLGAFWVSSRNCTDRGALCDLLGLGSHGTTYGGNPVVCAAGLVVLEVIEKENLLKNALELGAYCREELRTIQSPAITDIRALGLMIGIEFGIALDSLLPSTPEDPRPPATRLAMALISEGLLAIPAGERVLRFLPPLNVTRFEIDEAVEKLRRILQTPGSVLSHP